MTFILCKLGSKVWCYECESINDPYCNDPFNVSFDMSLMKMCEGCCVKIVLEKNTRKSLSSIPSYINYNNLYSLYYHEYSSKKYMANMYIKITDKSIYG